MKIKSIFLFSALISAFTMNSQEKNKDNSNPFFETYTTPYQIPPFHLIKNEHFKPALLEGIKRHEIEIET